MEQLNSNPSRNKSTLILVRHAHTAMAGTFCGISDPPLSTQGLAQLDALNRKLQVYPITHIFSSQLKRAQQTAESIANARGLQVEDFEFLHELTFGSWEGLDWNQVMVRDPEYAQRWIDGYPAVPAPEGENFDDFTHRVQYAMTVIAAQVQGGCAAVVTHAGVIRTFLSGVARWQGLALDFAECEYVSCHEVWCDGGLWYLPLGRSLQASERPQQFKS